MDILEIGNGNVFNLCVMGRSYSYHSMESAALHRALHLAGWPNRPFACPWYADGQPLPTPLHESTSPRPPHTHMLHRHPPHASR